MFTTIREVVVVEYVRTAGNWVWKLITQSGGLAKDPGNVNVHPFALVPSVTVPWTPFEVTENIAPVPQPLRTGEPPLLANRPPLIPPTALTLPEPVTTNLTEVVAS